MKILICDKTEKEYIDQMLKAIIGFTIEVETFDNVFKLSQNKTNAGATNSYKYFHISNMITKL